MRKFYLLILPIIFNSVFAFADAELAGKIRGAADEYIGDRFLNAVYKFVDEDGVILEGAKGVHSVASKKELNPSAQMPIASGTKTMTAAGILRLQDKNLLNVQDSIAKHLTADSGIWVNNEVPEWARQITIHNLLTHRSGVMEYFMHLQIDPAKSHAEINKDIANFPSAHPLKFTPGEDYNYCNTNYVLLGLIIEQASGKELGQFYQDELFGPLGLKNTRLLTLAEAIEHQTNPETVEYPVRYFVTPNGTPQPHFTIAQVPSLMTPFADGGVVSTTDDLIKWHQAIHAGKVLSKESYELMTTRHYEVQGWQGKRNYMGYGLYIAELENGDVLYQHAGRAVAIRSESGCILSKNLCFAVLSNVMDYVPEDMQGKIDPTVKENQLDIQHFLQHIFQAI